MKFKWGSYPEAPDFDPQSPWRPLDEPSPEELKRRAPPVAAVSALTVAILWILTVDVTRIEWLVAVLSAVVWFPGLIALHEAVHALLHPHFGVSRNTIVGYWPQHVFFYAAYLGEMSRERLACMILAPLVVLSFGPLLIALFTEVTSGITVSMSVTNAMLSCGDLIGVFYLIRGSPRKAIVRNKGWRTYWRKTAEPGATDNPGYAQ